MTGETYQSITNQPCTVVTSAKEMKAEEEKPEQDSRISEARQGPCLSAHQQGNQSLR